MIDDINPDSEDYELRSANALWIQEDFAVKEQYISNVENYYSGNVKVMDFVETR
ncbi:MAG: serpin family protein [Methanolobus sp.]